MSSSRIMNSRPESRRTAKPTRASSFAELTKPRITVFILMSSAIGFMCGAHLAPAWNWAALLHMLIGTGLLASGTAALNQWYENEGDALMRRTRGRAIPTGRVTAREGLWFGAGLSALGFADLCWGVNVLTGFLGLFTLVSYLFIY